MDTMTEKDSKTLKLLKSELTEIDSQLENYKESYDPSLYVMSRKEKTTYDINRECLKAQKKLLKRVILTLETLVY